MLAISYGYSTSSCEFVLPQFPDVVKPDVVKFYVQNRVPHKPFFK